MMHTAYISRLVGATAAMAMSLVLAACATGPASPRAAAQPTTPPSPARSASAGPETASGSGAAASHSAATTSSKPVRYVYPVLGHSSYAHTHHDYPASDMMAKCGTTVVAATSGTVLAVTRVDLWKPKVNAGATRGGLSVSILGDDGVRYYGSHLSAINSNIVVGLRVAAGQPLGKVGETGDASACHLHFGISPPCQRSGDWWIQRGVVWPWPYLDSWRGGGARSAVAEVAAWQAKHGCPSKPLVDP